MNLTFVPLAGEFWPELPLVFLILEIITFVVVGVICLMTMKLLRDVYIHIDDDMIRRDLLVLLSSPMIVSILSMIGNCLPRSAELMYAIGLVYLMGCLFRIVDLVYKLFGGRQQFAQWLKRNGRKIDFATTPFCCCCKCWPKAEPTAENLQRLQFFVLQSPLVRIIIQVTVIVLILEKVPEDSVPNQVLNGIGAASAITGVYITHILLKMTEDYLEQFNMVVLFKCVNFGQVLFTLMRFNFDIAFKNWKIGYTDVMSSEANGLFFFNVTAVLGSFVLNVVQFVKIRPERCALFGTSIHGRQVSIRKSRLPQSQLRSGLTDGLEGIRGEEEIRVITPSPEPSEIEMNERESSLHIHTAL